MTESTQPTDPVDPINMDVPQRSPLVINLRVLAFRATKVELDNLGRSHLLLGLLFTWLAGIGRYWDNPRAGLFQHLGLGSVVYIFVLAAFLYLFVKPLARERCDFMRLLTFIGLTSLPAIIYATPVERFMSLQGAQSANAWFLALVATWRLGLLFWYMRVGLGIGAGDVFVGGLLPMSLLITALTMLNLEHVVFQLMGGLRPEEQSPNDGAYGILFLLTYVAMVAFIPLLLSYIIIIFNLARRRKTQRQVPD